jgi:hypothetical protein
VAGLTVATLELGWDNYEPSNGSFNSSYIGQQQQKLQALKAAGFKVALDPGLQYPPSWVFGLDSNTYYVNQYGDRYAPGSAGQNVVNAVFDQNVRTAVAAYIARIASDFGDSFSFIRVGGGWYSELHYPPSNYNGHSNSYWAFDPNAQAGSPVPGWKPGQCCSSQAQQFWNYYSQSLIGYQNWQLQTYRSHFSAQLEMLYPSWGLRPGDITAAVNGNLSGSTSAEINGETQQDTDFADEVNAITVSNTVVYSTWLDAPDQGTTLNSESPIKYLVYLAQQKGLPAAGENAGQQSLSAMQLCVQRVKGLGLLGMSWAWESNLFSGSSPTLTDYQTTAGI